MIDVRDNCVYRYKIYDALKDGKDPETVNAINIKVNCHTINALTMLVKERIRIKAKDGEFDDVCALADTLERLKAIAEDFADSLEGAKAEIEEERAKAEETEAEE